MILYVNDVCFNPEPGGFYELVMSMMPVPIQSLEAFMNMSVSIQSLVAFMNW